MVIPRPTRQGVKSRFKRKSRRIRFNDEYQKSADVSDAHDPKEEAEKARMIFLGSRQEVIDNADSKEGAEFESFSISM